MESTASGKMLRKKAYLLVQIFMIYMSIIRRQIKMIEMLLISPGTRILSLNLFRNNCSLHSINVHTFKLL